MKHRPFRAICACLALLLAMTPVCASAEIFGLFGSEPEATAEPARSDDGVIRVMLASLGTPETVNLTLDGVYSVENDAGFTFAEGADVTLTAVDDCIYMVTGALTLALGGEVTFTRNSGEGGVVIAQAGSNRYCGDLTVWAAAGGLTMRLSTPIEEYLLGVVAYEMSDSFPIEALKAQAVAARTYAMYKKHHSGNRNYDVVDTTQDQVYKGVNDEYANVARAVEETCGIVGYYNDAPAVCYFTASNGGQTALATDIWGGSGDYGYLEITDDPYDLENPKSLVNSCAVYRDFAANGRELKQLLSSRLESAMEQAGLTAVKDAKIVEITGVAGAQPRFENTRQYEQVMFTVTAQAQRTIRVPVPMEYPDWLVEIVPQLAYEEQYQSYTYNVNFGGIEIALDTYSDVKDTLSLGLNGGDYEMVSVAEAENGWSIEMRRFGHGVGMSQRGAQWMAAEYGMGYMDILQFYYPGMSFETVQWTYEPVTLDDAVATLLRARGIAGTANQLPELQEGERYARVKLSSASSTLNMRAQPGTNSEIVTVLINRSRLIAVQVRDDGWTQVRTAVAEGYVKSEYLEIEE